MKRPRTALLGSVRGLPHSYPKVHTVQPDATLSAEQWVTWHMRNNKVCIILADRTEPSKP